MRLKGGIVSCAVRGFLRGWARRWEEGEDGERERTMAGESEDYDCKESLDSA